MQIFVRTLDDRTLTLDVEQREGNEYQRIL